MASIGGERDIRYSFIYSNNKAESVYLFFQNNINWKQLTIVETNCWTVNIFAK